MMEQTRMNGESLIDGRFCRGVDDCLFDGSRSGARLQPHSTDAASDDRDDLNRHDPHAVGFHDANERTIQLVGDRIGDNHGGENEQKRETGRDREQQIQPGAADGGIVVGTLFARGMTGFARSLIGPRIGLFL